MSETMTEAGWQAGGNPWPMLHHVSAQRNERKLRLIACLCCHRIWHVIPTEEARRCVEVAELYAEGIASRDDLDRAIHESMDSCASLTRPLGVAVADAINAVSRVHRSAEGGRYATIGLAASAWAASEARRLASTDEPDAEFDRRRNDLLFEELARQATLFREVFGSPFRPVAFNPAWRTTDATLLANGIYAERAFDRMPVLADALQDAGCDADELLAHLRDTTATHVRGCWALDLVLGKE
jgi:hypothetical protein